MVFQFWGNAVRGYIDTTSVFWWWGWQWFNPGSETEHGPLILALAGWVLWRNLQHASGRSGLARDDSGAVVSGAVAAGRQRDRAQARSYLGPAMTAMVGALVLHGLGFVVQQTRISIVAVLLFAWGVMRLGGGPGWGRAAVFPLGLMLFAMPLGVLDAVGFHLRLGVIATTEVLARLAGIDVVRNGTQLFAADGGYQYDVAAACSGVRSLLALLALASLVGYLGLRSNLRRGAVLLLAIPLTFVGNVVRIAAVVFAGEWLGQRAGEVLHDWAGFVVFVIVLGGVQWATTALARREPPPEAVADECNHNGYTVPGRWLTMAAGAVVVAALLTAVLAARVERWELRAEAGIPLAADGINPAPLPAFLGTDWIGQATEVTAVEREMLPADTGYARRIYVSLDDRRRQVLVSVVLSGQDRTSIHRPELCLVGQGWTIAESGGARFGASPTDAIPAALLRLHREAPASGGQLQRVPALFAYWFVGRDRICTTTASRLWHTALNRLRLRPDRWAYVVVQTVVLPEETETDARNRMDEVVKAIRSQLTP